ncbi:hypothetical protein HWN40_07135 [Methanolobus zinderi]|jgi:hypothetical protein|uniref:Uncharacterized protein n=1 Tax=Methanolobus zinderi TaxID=536044 RepID=A0A7D5J8Z7_9EURY|nr:hypothetical protein [Methanolobus zinderi]KXS42377.1 MAG: hypothetical protein AWU59_1658 [Methanolobus sp. T82-4]QLC50030.1 hypothetical protein HWN40_07135 [Methanolobus zinderi]
MPTTVKVNSAICGFTHKITGDLDGKNIIVDIETTCPKIQKMSHMEIPMMETMDIKDNYILDRAKEEQCTPGCIVPSGILHVCRFETGMISKNLAKKAGNISIDFDEL